jgi:hypothetical protein
MALDNLDVHSTLFRYPPKKGGVSFLRSKWHFRGHVNGYVIGQGFQSLLGGYH